MSRPELGDLPGRSQLLTLYLEIRDNLDFIRGTACALPQPALESVEDHLYDPQPGAGSATLLGDYRILREIGRGGMGVVYEAEQLSLGRRVALKVLPLAAALDARQLQRFKIEAQAAAQLRHPNIVRVHSIGFERGVHYYAMQLITGQTVAAALHALRQQYGLEPPPVGPITTRPTLAACSTKPAAPSPTYFRTVTELGIQAAEALEHAHRSGVVHRDIKPANLLLDEQGHLWVTDFGLAHVQGDPRLTVTGGMLGTPRYMSPEQALPGSGIVDHRTDIYALGVTLYELLTLVPAVAGANRHEVLQQLATGDPCPPRRLNPAIPLDLQTIVLKAAAREPVERYASAQEFADDLRRFLEDKPIHARRPGVSQWLARWARRHRTIVTGAALACVTAVVVLANSVVTLYRERAATVRQHDIARRVVDDMYTDVAEQWLEHHPQMEGVQREFLLRALRYYQQFSQEQGQNPQVRFATGLANRRIGDIASRLNDAATAAPAYEEAIRQLERLVGEYPEQRTYAAALAACQHHWALFLIQEQRLFDAEKAFLQAVAGRQQLAAVVSGEARYRFDMAVSLSSLARLLQGQGRRTEAERHLEHAWDLLEGLTSLETDPAYRAQVNETLGLLAGLRRWWNTVSLEQLFDQEEISRRLEQAIKHQRVAVTARPRDPKARQYLANMLVHRAQVLVRLENLNDAEAAYREAVPHRERLAEDFPRVRHYQRSLAIAYKERADVMFMRGQPQEARRDYARAIALHRELLKDYPDSPVAARDLAYLLAVCLDDKLRAPAEALRLAEQAVQQSPQCRGCWFILGVARYQNGDWPGAVAALTKGIEYGSGKADLEPLYLALAYWQIGDQALARQWYDQARNRFDENPPADGNLRRMLKVAATLIGSPLASPVTTVGTPSHP